MLQVAGDLNRSVTVQVVDLCDTCTPDVITLLDPQWASISATSADYGTSIEYRQVLQTHFLPLLALIGVHRKGGFPSIVPHAMGVLMMQVHCTPVSAWYNGGIVARVDQYKSDGTWMRVQFLQVAGPGVPSHVAVRSSLMSVRAPHI